MLIAARVCAISIFFKGKCRLQFLVCFVIEPRKAPKKLPAPQSSWKRGPLPMFFPAAGPTWWRRTRPRSGNYSDFTSVRPNSDFFLNLFRHGYDRFPILFNCFRRRLRKAAGNEDPLLCFSRRWVQFGCAAPGPQREQLVFHISTAKFRFFGELISSRARTISDFFCFG